MSINVNDVIDELHAEINAPAFYTKKDRTMHLPLGLANDALAALRWQADEIAQLREDLHGAMGAVVEMTQEIRDLEAKLDQAEETLSEYAAAELVREAQLDYYVGAR